MKRIFTALFAICFVSRIVADSINVNIDFGAPGTAPEPTFAAAGIPGFWNSTDLLNSTPTSGFWDIAGNSTSVALSSDHILADVTPGAQPFTGNDQKLLGDYVVSSGNNVSIQLTGLSAGEYVLHLYFVGRQDYPPPTTSRILPDSAVYSVTLGTWSGAYYDGFTHHSGRIHASGLSDVFSIDVSSPADAFINGMQIEAIPEPGTFSLLAVADCTIYFCRRKGSSLPAHRQLSKQRT